MLGAEVGTQVHNLPSPQPDEQPRRSNAKPLDARVGALVGIAQLLFAGAQVVHLANDLACEFFDAAEFSLDGLELLGGLDGGPVLGVGTNVDIEFDGASVRAGALGLRVALALAADVGEARLTACEVVLYADVECGIRV